MVASATPGMSRMEPTLTFLQAARLGSETERFKPSRVTGLVTRRHHLCSYYSVSYLDFIMYDFVKGVLYLKFMF